MVKVYLWDKNLGGSTLYTDPNMIRVTQQFDGARGQITEMDQRSRVEISGQIVRPNAPDFDIAMDRLRGGIHLLGVWDMEMRKQFKWNLGPAFNSSGAEFWHVTGQTETYNNNSANPPTGPWRSIFALAAGAAPSGATSLPIDGLISGEVIPRGTMIRVGDYRYRTTTRVTANGSGEATLTLASALRANVSNNAQVRVPGDFFVGYVAPGGIEVGASDVDGVRSFKLVIVEAYEDELADTSVSPTETFEYVIV